MTKVNQTKEDNFKNSLKIWDNETRPFIREKENFARDKFDYERKNQKIERERNEVREKSGNPNDKVHLWTSFGLESQFGPIKDWTPIHKEEE